MPNDIIIQGLPASTKTPGTYLRLIFGGPGTAVGQAEETIMLLGNMISSAITGSAPAFSVSAGTASLAVPTQVFDTNDAINKFGRGSELHLMCEAAFAADPRTVLWATPVDVAAGAVTAALTLVLSGTNPTGNLQIDMFCDGRTTGGPIEASALVDDIGTGLTALLNDLQDLPFTGQYNASTNTATFTMKEAGTRGNLYFLRIRITDLTTGKVYEIGSGTAAATVQGLTLTLGSAAGSFSGGTGTETTTLTTALNAIAAERWNRIVLAMEDQTNITAAVAQVVSNADVAVMLWEQLIVGNTRSFSASISSGVGGPKAMAATQNQLRLQLVWHYNSDRSPGVIAAQAAAARLMGDGHVQGSSVGEASDPAANLDATQMATVPVQWNAADRPLASQIETALNYGVTVLAPSSARPGFTQIVRSITTRFQDQTGATNYAVLDTSEVTVVDYEADLIRATVANTYPNHKLADDPANGDPPNAPMIVTPGMLKSLIASVLRTEEREGHIINTDQWMSALSVVRDGNARGRANSNIPIEPAPGFHIFGGNVRQVAS